MKDYNEMAESLFRRREKYIAERRRKRNILIKASSGLGCLCLTALSGLWTLKHNPAPEADFPANITPIAIEDMRGPLAVEADHPDSGGITQNTEKRAGDSDSEAHDKNTENNSPDAPVSEQSPGSLQHITANGSLADFFGGSYTNSQGILCILLTEDTPENRSAACREFNLAESNTLFQKADYTLSYLTNLQAMISAGMISRELNFVTCSSLREDTNRIHLTVTTQEPSQLEKLKALDSLGGAMVIEYLPDGDSVDLLIEKKTSSPE